MKTCKRCQPKRSGLPATVTDSPPDVGPEDFAMTRPHMRKFDTHVGDAAAIFVFTHFAIRQSNPSGAELDFRTQHARRWWLDARDGEQVVRA